MLKNHHISLHMLLLYDTWFLDVTQQKNTSLEYKVTKSVASTLSFFHQEFFQDEGTT